MGYERLFLQSVPDEFPRLERLFDQAKRDFWDEATVIDWSRDFELPAPMRQPLAKVLSIIYYGERVALEVSAQLIPLVDDEQCKFALAAQVIEEAKHVSVFRRVLTKLDRIHPVDPWSRRLLSDLVRCSSAVQKLVGMQLIVENVANHLFDEIGAGVPDPLLKEVLGYVQRDEKKHTGLAAIYLPAVLDNVRAHEIPILKARQFYWSFCLDRVIYNHRREAAALGIDLYEALQKGIRSQERLVERMGTSRGIWKNRLLEAMSLRIHRAVRHQPVRHAPVNDTGRAKTASG